MRYMTSLKPTIPGTYVNLLADVVSRWSVSAEDLFLGSGIEPKQIYEPIWYVDIDVGMQLIQRALLLTGEPGLGFHLGMQMTVTCHGLIGFAAMVSSNVRGALQVAQEFIALQSTVHKIRLEEQGELAYLYFEQSEAYQYDEVIQIALILGFAQMGKAVSGQELRGVADLPFAQPEYFDRFIHLIPGEVRFEQKCACMIFDKNILDIPLIMADLTTARLAREQCKRLLHGMAQNPDFKRLVLDLIYDEAQGFSSMPEVAEKLHISERSLQRKLTEEGVSFRDLVEDLRFKKALALLKNRSLTLKFIAEHLGYTDVTNFSRAFKRWTGKSPRRYY